MSSNPAQFQATLAASTLQDYRRTTPRSSAKRDRDVESRANNGTEELIQYIEFSLQSRLPQKTRKATAQAAVHSSALPFFHPFFFCVEIIQPHGEVRV